MSQKIIPSSESIRDRTDIIFFIDARRDLRRNKRRRREKIGRYSCRTDAKCEREDDFLRGEVHEKNGEAEMLFGIFIGKIWTGGATHFIEENFERSEEMTHTTKFSNERLIKVG